MKAYQPIKVENLFNEAIQGHRQMSEECTGHLIFDQSAEKKFGLCWQERLRCTDCDYVSSVHKLYEEVPSTKRGRKAAAPNLGLHVGANHTSTGNAGIRHALNAANIASPSKSAMQKQVNKVADQLIRINQEDMKKICEDLTLTNKLRGRGGRRKNKW